jgi:isopentenyl diphosphate isomerase/L-lactate dehydrogenase-like FMN-dependent dehydrogenase
MRVSRIVLDLINLMPCILRDVSPKKPGIELFGKRHDLPLITGPTGPAGFVC